MNVCILMATYNGEKYLSQQIDSILDQTYNNFKIYISDDGSTDNTKSIITDYCKKYPEKIFLIAEHSPTGSASNNFLYLLEHIEGDIFLFSDQDDIWERNHIELLINKYLSLSEDERQKPVCVHSDLSVVNANLELISNSMFDLQKLPRNPKSRYFYFVQNNVTGCTLLINQSLKNFVFHNKDLLNANKEKILMHDLFCASIASLFGAIYFINTPIILYRQHGNNTVGAKNVRSLGYLITKWKQQKKVNNVENYLEYSSFFYKYFDDFLSNDDKNFLLNYSTIKSKNKIYRILFLMRYHALKYGFIRNCNFLLQI